MKLKKALGLDQLRTCVCVTIAGAILHGLFDLWPSILTEFAAPVNESIWEHMKIVFWPLLVGLLVLYGGKKTCQLPSNTADVQRRDAVVWLDLSYCYWKHLRIYRHCVLRAADGVGLCFTCFSGSARDLDALAFGRDSFAGGPDGNLYDHAAGFPSVPRCVTGGRMGSISLLRNQIQPGAGAQAIFPKNGRNSPVSIGCG